MGVTWNKNENIRKDYTSGLGSLKKKIEQIENSYRDTIAKTETAKPTTPDLPDLSYKEQYKTYDAPDDETLNALAKAEADRYDAENRGKITGDTDNKIKNLNSAKEKALLELENSLAESDEYYEDARKSSSDSALKRGLARSSVAQLSQDSINASQAAVKSQMRGEAGRAVSQLDEEIAAAETARQEALSALDIRTAATLTQKLAELQSERDKKAAEVLEYNNALKERLTKLAMEQQEFEQKYEDNELDLEKKRKKAYEDAVSQASSRRDENVYKEISDYLSELPASEARRQLEKDPYFKSVLGEYHYALLRNALNGQ